jgi:hypothetical protein
MICLIVGAVMAAKMIWVIYLWINEGEDHE